MNKYINVEEANTADSDPQICSSWKSIENVLWNKMLWKDHTQKNVRANSHMVVAASSWSDALVYQG